MRYLLEHAPGPARVAVLVECGHRLAGRGAIVWKRPVAVVFDGPEGRRVTDLAGRPIPPRRLAPAAARALEGMPPE